jgi:hypothetical protein
MEVAVTDVAKQVRKHREKMKAAGLKAVATSVPDANAPGYREEIRRQCELINADPESERVWKRCWLSGTSAIGNERGV